MVIVYIFSFLYNFVYFFCFLNESRPPPPARSSLGCQPWLQVPLPAYPSCWFRIRFLMPESFRICPKLLPFRACLAYWPTLVCLPATQACTAVLPPPLCDYLEGDTFAESSKPVILLSIILARYSHLPPLSSILLSTGIRWLWISVCSDKCHLLLPTVPCGKHIEHKVITCQTDRVRLNEKKKKEQLPKASTFFPLSLSVGILEVLHCVLVESPEALNIIKEGHIKSIISLLDKHGRNHKVRELFDFHEWILESLHGGDLAIDCKRLEERIWNVFYQNEMIGILSYVHVIAYWKYKPVRKMG